MEKDTSTRGRTGATHPRDARLKSALRDNLAKRKAQVRARRAGGDGAAEEPQAANTAGAHRAEPGED